MIEEMRFIITLRRFSINHVLRGDNGLAGSMTKEGVG